MWQSDVSPDPNDNVFCACAEQGRAAFIATLNRKDFPQKKLVAKVISPSDPMPTTRRRRSSLTADCADAICFQNRSMLP